MVSKRKSTAMWCGGTGIRAASNLSNEATPERRAEAAGARRRRRYSDADLVPLLERANRLQLGGGVSVRMNVARPVLSLLRLRSSYVGVPTFLLLVRFLP